MTETGDLTDGDIIRYLDRECPPEEAQYIAAHLTRCNTCRERVEVLQKRLGVLSSLLNQADFTPEERAPRRAWFDHSSLRAAAIILVTLGVGLSFTPVRAWVVETWLRAAVSLSPTTVGDVRGAPGYGIVSFAVDGPSLTIEVAAVQAGGELHVRVGDGGLASARVDGGDGSEELVVLPGALRIVSSPSSGADYHVVVPAGLAGISVRIGEGELLRFATDDLRGAGESFALTGSSARTGSSTP